jgi:hypothetical protein
MTPRYKLGSELCMYYDVFNQAVLVREVVTLNCCIYFLFARSRARSLSSESRLSRVGVLTFDATEPGPRSTSSRVREDEDGSSDPEDSGLV